MPWMNCEAVKGSTVRLEAAARGMRLHNGSSPYYSSCPDAAGDRWPGYGDPALTNFNGLYATEWWGDPSSSPATVIGPMVNRLLSDHSATNSQGFAVRDVLVFQHKAMRTARLEDLKVAVNALGYVDAWARHPSNVVAGSIQFVVMALAVGGEYSVWKDIVSYPLLDFGWFPDGRTVLEVDTGTVVLSAREKLDSHFVPLWQNFVTEFVVGVEFRGQVIGSDAHYAAHFGVHHPGLGVVVPELTLQYDDREESVAFLESVQRPRRCPAGAT